MCTIFFKELKKALLDKDFKQRDIVDAIGVSEARVSQLMHGQHKNDKFDAWCLLNLDIDVPKLREKLKSDSFSK